MSFRSIGYSAASELQLMSTNSQQRKPWVTPTLRRIEAGSAEAGSGSKKDAGKGSLS